ncbi:glucose 1-dehydrogenase [Abditibacteriota bacterium]|nr:glucose 1-dehydrogenase [Abditibacteriota bacterium]
MTISLEGKSILIIGGARRIGRAIALECARSGAKVAFTFNTSHDEAQSTLAGLRQLVPTGQFAAYPLNVTDASAWLTLAEDVERDFGSLFGLVFCAAIFKRTPPTTLSVADFDEHIAVNLKGPFLGCHTFGERLEEGGSIVLFSDIYATRPLLNYIPYCTSKAGVEMLCKGFAKALAPRRVRVNCIAPGAILPVEGEENSVEELVARVPLRRLGGVEEVARTAVFLLGGSEFLTGIIIPLEGGQLLR